MTAALELAKYGKLQGRAEFLLSQFSDSTSPVTGEAARRKTSEALLGIMDGGIYGAEYVRDLVTRYNDHTPYPIRVLTDRTNPSLSQPKAGIGTGGPQPLTQILGTPPPSQATNSSTTTSNGNTQQTNQSNAGNQTTISLIQIRNPHIGFGATDPSILDVFFNLIPGAEWSKCVPYLNVRIVSPIAPEVQQQDSDGSTYNKSTFRISSLRFLNGVSRIEGNADSLVNIAKSEADRVVNRANVQRQQQIARQRDQPLTEGEIAAAREQISSAGMELFTSPQTLIPNWEEYSSVEEVANFQDLITPARRSAPDNLDGLGGRRDTAVLNRTNNSTDFSSYAGGIGSKRSAPIIDKARPFMTLEGVDISDVPTGHGMITQRTAEIKITLHDRSRLAEISDLVKPGMYNRISIFIEWGWSHPDNDSPYGKFINALRSQGVFSVSRTSYGFTDDGQAKISLNCNTTGFLAVQNINVGLSSTVVGNIETLRRASVALRRAFENSGLSPSSMQSIEAATEIQGYSSNYRSFLTKEVQTKLETFINSLNVSSSSQHQTAASLGPAYRDLQAALIQVRNSAQGAVNQDSGQSGGISNSINEKLTRVEKDTKRFFQAIGNSRTAVSNISSKTKSVFGQFFIEDGNGSAQRRSPQYWQRSTETRLKKLKLSQNLDMFANNTVTFGQLATVFVAQPLKEAGVADEVQLIFYNFNQKCSHMSGYNIGCFPVNLPKFKENFTKYREKRPVSTPSDFVNFFRTYYIQNLASEAYGFTEVYKRSSENFREQRRVGSATGAERVQVNRTLDVKFNEVLADAYGVPSNTPGLIFKKPRFKMYVDTVPHNGNDGNKKIMRICFFDEQATVYNSQSDLLRAATNDFGQALQRSVVSANQPLRGVSTPNQKQAEAAVKNIFSQLLEPIPGQPDAVRLKVGAAVLKAAIKNSMPSITYGSQESPVSKLDYKSNSGNSLDTTINIQRSQAGRNRGGFGSVPAPEIVRGLPLVMLPGAVSLSMMGFPMLKANQDIFIDAGTGTTVDNCYKLRTVKHSITEGKFETSVDALPHTAYGQIQGGMNRVNDMLATLGPIARGENQSSTPTNATPPSTPAAPQNNSNNNARSRVAQLERDGEARARQTPVASMSPWDQRRVQNIMLNNFTPNQKDTDYWERNLLEARTIVIGGKNLAQVLGLDPIQETEQSNLPPGENITPII
jgi:hypothetical protein